MSHDLDLTEDTNEEKPSNKGRKPKKARYLDYVNLINEVLGETKRDIFTGDLCYFDKKADRWLPVFHENAFGRLKSVATDNASFYASTTIEHHIYRRTMDLDRDLLCDIPVWDGVDRIGQVAHCLKATNLPCAYVEELLKDYCGKIFTRLFNPAKQNRILVLSGAQGLGKDYLVNALFGAFGQYLLPFTICQKESDTQAQLIAGALLVISEYDRTSRTDVSTLKNMITAPRAYFRAAYGRRAIDHPVRSSFIATCNLDGGILRDHTGNRRYIIFQLEDIEWAYPQHESPQILAQCLRLSEEGFQASGSAEAALDEYLEEQTPENPEDQIRADYESLMLPNTHVDGYASDSISTTWENLHKKHPKYSINILRSIIKRSGYHAKMRDGQFYFRTVDECNQFREKNKLRKMHKSKSKISDNSSVTSPSQGVTQSEDPELW